MAGRSGNGRFRARLPWPVRLVICAAIVSGTYLAAWRIHPSPHQPWQEAAITGAVMGAVLFGVISLISRWQGGPEAQRAAQKALRRKRIPEGVDPSLVRRGLEGVRNVARRARWWGSGALVLITGGAAALAAVRGGAALWWVVLFLAMLTVGIPLLFAVQLKRVDRLLAELDEREGRA